jgi:hypothetical protein
VPVAEAAVQTVVAEAAAQTEIAEVAVARRAVVAAVYIAAGGTQAVEE